MYSLYCLTFPNNKRYIGITSNFQRRMSQHKYESKKRNFKLQFAIRKYGWKSVKKEILVFNLSKEHAQNLEANLISDLKLLDVGYNTTPGGEHISPNNRQLMQKRMSNPEYRKKCVDALKSNEKQRIEKLGSPETRALNSAAQKKRYLEGKSKLPDNSKSIMCIETGVTFKSAKDAADNMGLSGRLIRRVANGERSHHKGYTFKFIEVTNDIKT